jgi:CxxC motif-containing protein (DUF1111 family)
MARSDLFDCDQDGISGRVSFVRDPASGVLRIGRFGWKAEKVSLQHQVADDAASSLGVGTRLIPDSAGNVELDDDDLGKLTSYVSLGGVPPQRNGEDPQVKAGEALFATVGCARCHVTDVVTGANHPFAELRGQAIRPYTDLLLHDMGLDLADDSAVPSTTSMSEGAPASASEWRTPPLWGVGLRAAVSPGGGLLHDGRAASVLEAILWHGGEAARSEAIFLSLSSDDRAALLAFVESL